MRSRAITAAFIDQLRNTQNALQREWSMNQVEMHYRKAQYAWLETHYLDRIARQKRHYMFVYLLVRHYSSPKPSFPPWCTAFLQATAWSSASAPYPALAAIIHRVANVRNRELMDALAFSGLPCYFTFFFTDFGTEDFLMFMRTISDRPLLSDMIARMAFVSPLFLSFIASVFHPIISPLLPQAPVPSLEDLSAQIATRWTNNASAIPSVVVRLIRQSPDPVRTLSVSYFEQALTPKTASVYGLVHFHQTLQGPILERLKQLLTASSRTHMLERLVATTQASKSAIIPSLTVIDRNDVPALFQRLILSPVDFNCYSAASILGEFVDPFDYDVAAYLQAGEAEQESHHNRIEQTMGRESVAPNAAVRHLLQGADPIPTFAGVPPGTTVESFFRDYLLDRGPIDEYPLRYTCFKVLEKDCRWDPVRLQVAMDSATLERTKEIRALSAFTRIANTVARFDQLTKAVADETEHVFLTALLESALPKKFKPRRSIEDYTKAPNHLVNEYCEVLRAAQQTTQYQSPWLPHVVFGALTSGFDFERFRKVRSDLRSLDSNLTTIIVNRTAALLPALFSDAGAPKSGAFDKRGWLLSRLQSVQSNIELLAIIQRACLESNPLSKMEEMNRGITLFRKFCLDGCPSTVELGADEYIPALVGYFYIANPPYLVSNLIFIQEFCCSPRLEAVFLGNTVPPVSILTVVCGNLPDFHKEKYVRQKS
jgi:hypothetical protein